LATTRRELLLGSLAAGALWGKNKIGHSQISAISDEIAKSPEEAIAFAHQYGMQWLELRDVPGNKGHNYYLGEESFVRSAAKQFADAHVRISFLNTNLLKFGLPGTEPVRRTPEKPEARAARLERDKARFDRREDDLRKCIKSAQILGCKHVRVFTFSRIEQPETVYPQVADIIGAFSKVAEQEGVMLLVENETSCNVAKCSEVASFLKLVPSKALGVNWDVMNGADMKEVPLPDGYSLLPKKRVHNVQIKGRSILDYPQKLDWTAIFNALASDGFKDQIGLETHIFGPEQVQKSHESMRAILKLVDPEFQPRQQAT
jgi:L-ribulose-5-phosphate 3-epimerase